jgi:hypothetical protein
MENNLIILNAVWFADPTVVPGSGGSSGSVPDIHHEEPKLTGTHGQNSGFSFRRG